VFEELIDGFGFKLMMKEDITLNINQSRKVLGRIYKNRLIPWGIGKVKNYLSSVYEHDNIVSRSIRGICLLIQLFGGNYKNCQELHQLSANTIYSLSNMLHDIYKLQKSINQSIIAIC
jgi:hypothetical protein